MTTTSTQQDPFVVLYGVPWENYGKILEALGRYHLRHAYVKGTLEMRGLLYGVTWDDYMAFLDALGDHSLRHTYDRGTLEMMAPRKDHDWPKRFIGRIIEALALHFDIEIQCIGSTTITGSQVERGFQPDEAYYVANESRVRGKAVYDPEVDPPPDLLVEVDVTSSSVKRMPGFALLGIREVWRHAGDRIRFFILGDSGEYEESLQSVAFPFLSPEDINGCLDKLGEMSENAVLRTVIQDLDRRVAPRRSATQQKEMPNHDDP